MRAAGYTVTEWDESFGSDVAALNDAKREAGVAFCGAYRWLNFQDPSGFARDVEEIRPFLEVLAGIGAGHLIVADAMRPERIAMAGSVPTDGSASLTPSAMRSLTANVAALYDVASQYGLWVHYHNHVGTYVETPPEVEACANGLAGSPVSLCFDTGHYAFGGGNAVQFLETHLDAIGYLHLKDVDPVVFREAKAHTWSFLDSLRQYIFCPLGEGNADVPGIIRRLVTKCFAGPVVIEQDTCRGNATESARSNLEAVENMTRSVPNAWSDRI
jgi:inosose dehydratase